MVHNKNARLNSRLPWRTMSGVMEDGLMAITIPLRKMTIPDKLRALEEIWEDLLRTPKDIPSPSWHGDVLHAREDRVREGTSRYGDWTEAKHRIRERTK